MTSADSVDFGRVGLGIGRQWRALQERAHNRGNMQAMWRHL